MFVVLAIVIFEVKQLFPVRHIRQRQLLLVSYHNVYLSPRDLGVCTVLSCVSVTLVDGDTTS